MTLDTTPQPPRSGAGSSTPPSVPDVSMLAASMTLAGMRAMAEPATTMPLERLAIASALFPAEETTAAVDRLELHVLLLEDTGKVTTTGGPDGREWIDLAPTSRPMFSPGVSEGARESAGARGRARERERPPLPQRPWQLDAPPIGCVDHPNGSRWPCGPCRTARLQHEQWWINARYQADLARHYGDDPRPSPDQASHFDPPPTDTLFDRLAPDGETYDEEPW